MTEEERVQVTENHHARVIAASSHLACVLCDAIVMRWGHEAPRLFVCVSHCLYGKLGCLYIIYINTRGHSTHVQRGGLREILKNSLRYPYAILTLSLRVSHAHPA